MCRYLDLQLFSSVDQGSKVAEGGYTIETQIPVATALTVPHASNNRSIGRDIYTVVVGEDMVGNLSLALTA